MDIVIVGGGQASASLIGKLRDMKFWGEITLLSSENYLPYQRPPLSKKYLLGEVTLDRLLLRPKSYYDEMKIRLELGKIATRIDPISKKLYAGNQSFSFDHLVLTTGSWPKKLPYKMGGDLKGVYTLRNLSDIDSLTQEFQKDRNLLIVGGGYIGLEAAAVAAKKGLKVTLIETAERILQRVAAPETSDYFRELHQSEGVTILEGISLETLNGKGNKVVNAILSDGSKLDVDFVVVGVGILPATELAETCGLKVDNGIFVNEFGQTSESSIWAAGDCASFSYDGDILRIESVQNAIDQSEIVAQNILGSNKEYVPKPWFWSDQFDTKLQIAGLSKGYTEIIKRRAPKRETISFWYYKKDTLIAVDAINDPRAFMVGKRLIEAGISPEKTLIESSQTNLKELLD